MQEIRQAELLAGLEKIVETRSTSRDKALKSLVTADDETVQKAIALITSDNKEDISAAIEHMHIKEQFSSLQNSSWL